MKKILIGLVLLIALGFGGLLLFLNPIVNKFKTPINETISGIIKQQVTIGDIGLSLFPEIGIKLADVNVENKGKVEASLKKLFLHTGLSKLIKGDLSVDTFSISDANINLVKKSDGSIYLGEFPLTQKPAASQAEQAAVAPGTIATEKKAVNFNLKNIDFSGLNLNFKDQSKTPEAEYKIQNFTIKAADIGTNGQGSFSVNGKVIGADLDLKGKIDLGKTVKIESLNFVAGDQSIQVKADIDQTDGIKANSNLSSGSLALEQFVGALLPAMAEKVKGMKLDGLKVDSDFSSKTAKANSNIFLSGVSLGATKLVSNVALKVNAALKPDNSIDSVDLEKSSFEMFGGKVDLDAQVRNSTNVSSTIKATGMNLANITSFVMPNSKIGLEGELTSADIKSSLNSNSPATSINAQVNVTAEKGSITGFNIVKEALGKLNGIPGLEAALLSYVPEKYAPLINGSATEFDHFTLSNSLNGQNVNINSMSLEHPLYKITGQGSASTAGTFKINAKLILNPSLAQGMIAKQDKLKYLSEVDGSIVVPLVIEKTGKTPVVLPDAEDLLKRAAKNSIKDAGMKALEKVAPGLDKVIPGIGKALNSLF